jgi:hypothetical protein
MICSELCRLRFIDFYSSRTEPNRNTRLRPDLRGKVTCSDYVGRIGRDVAHGFAFHACGFGDAAGFLESTYSEGRVGGPVNRILLTALDLPSDDERFNAWEQTRK